MVKGWMSDSYWEARMMYMKMMERRNAQRNSVKVRSISRVRPTTSVLYMDGRFILATASSSAALPSLWAKPGADDARSEMVRWRSKRSMREALGTVSSEAMLANSTSLGALASRAAVVRGR